jgi:aspartyl-tRNA(Asn)/glutamyl-tRNA(Gln) amidotransferase subunit A
LTQKMNQLNVRILQEAHWNKESENMSDPPLHYQSITELAPRLRQSEISPVELTEHYLARVESLDGKLNAYRLVCGDRAMEEARAAEAALRVGKDLDVLHGIPYSVKDLFDIEGLPTTAGTSLLEENIAARSAHACRKLGRAGMILLGKTNTVQFAYGGVGINHDHGTPWNPWSKTHRVPGGSSSGSAVAVAAGMAPVALGTDTGGSVRVPASLCGIVGLKTTVGRIGRSGVYPLSWSLDSVGVLSRSVEDAAFVYQCMQGADRDDETTWGLAQPDTLKGLKKGVRGMRLAFAESVFWENVNPEIDKAVRECGRVFEELGARVSSVPFSEAEEARQLNPKGLIIAAEAYTLNKKWLEEYFDRLDPIVSHRMINGKTAEASEYLQNNFSWKQLRAKAVNALTDVDALLVPTTAIHALPVTDVDADMNRYADLNITYLRNTSIGSTLNMCGLSVPCGFTQEGLPIGLMVYGKPFQEDVVLRVGYAFQQVTDWHRRTPELSWAAKE